METMVLERGASSYVITDTTVTLGEAVQVARRTVYEETGSSETLTKNGETV